MAIFQSIESHPADRIAVRVGALDISYGRLLADVAAAAASLAVKGVGETSKVGIRAGPVPSGHCYANWVAHLASLWLGAAHSSIVEPTSMGAALKAGLIDTMIGSAGALDDVPAGLNRIVFDCDPQRPPAPCDPPPNREVAASRINLTSGTTGKPKFLVWDSAMIEARIKQVADGIAISSHTMLYCLLHMRTTAGFRYPLAVWQAGGCVLLPDDSDVAMRDRVAIGPSTLIAASPVQLAERLRAIDGDWDGREGRTIIVLGGRLPGAVRDQALRSAAAHLLISYGSTETGSIALGSSDLIERHVGAVGFVRSGVELDIVDANKKAVPAGEPGLVRIKSALMTGGYEATDPGQETGHFDGDYFYPGDIGRLFDDGLLAIEGRLTDTLNVGGWKVSAPELESKLSFLPGVDDLVACVMPLAEGDLLTFAVVTHNNVDLKSVAARIQEKLPKGRTFHLLRLKSIPRNAMGKVPRAMIANRLTALYGASRKNFPHA